MSPETIRLLTWALIACCLVITLAMLFVGAWLGAATAAVVGAGQAFRLYREHRNSARQVPPPPPVR